MGKRRERRKAAMAATRRVKLDIFHEPPSGDPGGSPVQDELGGDTDMRHHDGSPNSPSSSGKQPENPLLLLGQYSDEEAEEQSSQQAGTPEVSAVEIEQVNGLTAADTEDRNGEAAINSDSPYDKELALDELEPGQIDAAGADDVSREVSVQETTHSEALDVQFSVDANTDWQIVLHEESGQYYYWNTVTGETSWVVPDILVAGSEVIGDGEAAPDSERSRNGIEQTNPALNVELNGSSSTVHIKHHSVDSERANELEEKNEPGSRMQGPVDGLKDDDVEDNKEVPDAGQTKKCVSNQMVHEDNDLDNDLCYSVLRHGESLLERFKLMERSRNKAEGNDWISSYILEVEIRLSDVKSLLSSGSSLLPFWVHCERKLKDLEAAFNAEVCQFFIDETQAVEALDASPASEGNHAGIDIMESSTVVSDTEKLCLSSYADKSTAIPQDQQKEAAHSSVRPDKVSSIEYGGPHSATGLEVNIVQGETAKTSEIKPESVLQNVDEDVDMDMDVDMEVEEAKERHCHPNPPVGSISFLSQEILDVPPPPGEDWIPPPPPDSEPVPPPPPDDSADPFYPPPPPDDQTEPSYPTYSQTVQPLSYSEQYSYTYPNSNFQYYDQTGTEYPANSMYQQAVTVPNASVYYETLPSYPGVAPVLVTPVESVAHYDDQDSAVIHGSVVTDSTSSGLHGEPGVGAISSAKNSSLNSQMEINHAPLSDAGLGGSAVIGGTGKETKGALIAQTPVVAANSVIESGPKPSVAANTVIESGPVPSIAAATVASDVVKSTATTVQSKVLRTKKRAIAAVPTLRANKKVSSLVDKWKAAKEELHEEEEDEPESAYEFFEKKRQREIEKWRKQQIASGEAKENANFQPLGGDWRERVKRKRAQLQKEEKKSPSDDTTDKNKQPDLLALSRDLPAGWQVYWDESSKQVYYGNTITSETTWTRPGK